MGSAALSGERVPAWPGILTRSRLRVRICSSQRLRSKRNVDRLRALARNLVRIPGYNPGPSTRRRPDSRILIVHLPCRTATR